MNSTITSNDAQDRLLSQLEQFLPEELADELIRHHTSVIYAKDAIIFRQGSSANFVFWTVSGLVKLYRPISDGDRTLVRLCGPGDVLGYADFIDADNRHLQAFEAQASTKCTIALFTREHAFRILGRLDQPTLLRLIVKANTAWSSVACSLAETLGCSFRDRLDVTLRNLATRFGVEDKRGMLLPMRLSHSDLAEMIACSRPMVTRMINEMIEEQLLERAGQLYIVRNGVHKNAANAATNGHTNSKKNGKGRLEPKSTIRSTFVANYPRN
jgi:CRP-like cAMP-binding protein